ncbi:MAG: leucine-rich repeat protein [Clostridia bacterium]|nr:leucine-rich repeat protein [Clostridia bacterium]
MKKLLGIVLFAFLIISFLFIMPVSAEIIVFSDPNSPGEKDILHYIPDDEKPIIPTEPETEPGDITTSFDEETGTLTVSGTGRVSNLFGRSDTDIAGSVIFGDSHIKADTSVKHIIIENGITEIYNSFNDMHSLKDVSFPKTLERINLSFVDCDSLKMIKIPKSVKSIGRYSFYDCDGLTKIKFLGPLSIGDEDQFRLESYVFCELDSLKYVVIPKDSSVGYVFKDCKNLKAAFLGLNTKLEVAGFDYFDECATTCFNGCNKDLTIYSFWGHTDNWETGGKTFCYGPLLILVGILLLPAIIIVFVLFIKKNSQKIKNT